MIAEKSRASHGFFFCSVLFLTFLQTFIFFQQLSISLPLYFRLFWAVLFSLLALNISVLFFQAVYMVFHMPPLFLKADRKFVRDIPVALIFCMKNESFGLYQRIRYTVENNLSPNVHLWLLSDSSAAFREKEKEWIRFLAQDFPELKIYYRNRTQAYERKQGGIHDWLTRFGRDYSYFVVCDADSLLPSQWLTDMLCIAEHPAQKDAAVFQSAIYVTHESSWYARMQAVAQYYSQKIYFAFNQALFQRTIAFGHNCLIRREAFEKIQLPAGILSHDNWETALLEQAGYRTVFVSEVISYEEAASHFLEDRKRSSRWLTGTLQGWPLLFLSRISLATRFLIFYQIYSYFIQPVLLLWICGGFYLSRLEAFSGGIASSGLVLLIFSLAILFFHRWPAAKNSGDILRLFQETIFSALIGLQNIFYGTVDFLFLPLKKMGWTPMAKEPGARLQWHECMRALLPGTVVGFLFIIAGINYSIPWLIYSLPIIASLILSIPSVYFSSLPYPAFERTQKEIRHAGS